MDYISGRLGLLEDPLGELEEGGGRMAMGEGGRKGRKVRVRLGNWMEKNSHGREGIRRVSRDG